MLTGDKKETAENIGYSTRLLQSGPFLLFFTRLQPFEYKVIFYSCTGKLT